MRRIYELDKNDIKRAIAMYLTVKTDTRVSSSEVFLDATPDCDRTGRPTGTYSISARATVNVPPDTEQG